MVPIPYSLTAAGVGTGLPGGWLEDLCSYFVCHGHPSPRACRESRRLLPAACPSVTPATLSRGLEAPAVWGFCRLEQAWYWSSGRPESANMLRGPYLAAGDRFTVRVGGVVVGIGKVAVQDAWSRGGPRQEGRNAGHKRRFAALEGERSLTVQTRRRSHANREGRFRRRLGAESARRLSSGWTRSIRGGVRRRPAVCRGRPR